MTNLFKKQLVSLGINLDITLDRFMGNEVMYVKFLSKFVQDNTYDNLQKALNEKDYERAMGFAHTLKGITGNLGMDVLAFQFNELVKEFRIQNYDFQMINDKMDEIDNEYKKHCSVISQNV